MLQRTGQCKKSILYASKLVHGFQKVQANW